MTKMLDNCFYNQVKLLHNLSCILWFIEKHGKCDAQKANDDQCLMFLEKLEKDVTEHIGQLKNMVCK